MRGLVSLLLIPCLIACSDDDNSGAADVGVDKTVIDAAPATCGTSAFLPADSAVGNLKQKGTPKIADTGKLLDLLINGGSEKYKTNKFTCMVEASYADATNGYTAQVWIFDQTDKTGAEGAYKATSSSDYTDISPTIGDASNENLKLLADYVGYMRKGKYVARVSIDDLTAKADGQAMLKAIAGLIK